MVVIFHHLAAHRCPQFPLASARRINDAALLKRTRALVDIVFWNNKIYECDINTAAIKQLGELLTPEEEEDTSVNQPTPAARPTPVAKANPVPATIAAATPIQPPAGAVATPFQSVSSVSSTPVPAPRTAAPEGPRA